MLRIKCYFTCNVIMVCSNLCVGVRHLFNIVGWNLLSLQYRFKHNNLFPKQYNHTHFHLKNGSTNCFLSKEAVTLNPSNQNFKQKVLLYLRFSALWNFSALTCGQSAKYLFNSTILAAPHFSSTYLQCSDTKLGRNNTFCWNSVQTLYLIEPGLKIISM